MDVAIVGGTGAEGFGLALRLAKAGHHVTIGSRVVEKAAAGVQEAKKSLGPDASVDGDVNAGSVVGKAVVFVTVPFAGQALVYDAIKDALAEGTVVCDCTSPLMTAVGGRASHALRPGHGSAPQFSEILLSHGTPLGAPLPTTPADVALAMDQEVDSG